MRVSHPLNPRSEIFMKRLGDPTGMTRIGVNLARIPPGKESFAPHAHSVQEEWVYVLEGTGRALVGEEEHEIGPGDFLGFPTDGVAHHLRNTGTTDLVVLQGSERSRVDVGHFPTLKKRLLFLGDDVVRLVPEDAIETLPLTAWRAKDPDGT